MLQLAKYGKYFIPLGLLAVVIIFIIPKIKNMIAELFKPLPTSSSNMVNEKQKRAAGIASQIAASLGTAEGMSWYNLGGWYETETTTIDLLNQNIDIMPEVEAAYRRISTNGSPLWMDVQALLSSDDIAKIIYLRG